MLFQPHDLRLLIAASLMSAISAVYMVVQRFQKPKILIEDFDPNEEKDMSEDQPGVQSELEVAAVEYVRNANQDTLAKLREAALNYCDSLVAPKKKAPVKKTKK